MKYRETTFVLAVASALCATPATASINDDCKFLKTYGEAEIGKWVDRQSKLLEMAKAQAKIPSWQEYQNQVAGYPLTDAELKQFFAIAKKPYGKWTSSDKERFRKWDDELKIGHGKSLEKLREEWKALASAKSGKTAPPAVELDRAEQLATIYTAFCKR